MQKLRVGWKQRHSTVTFLTNANVNVGFTANPLATAAEGIR